MRATSLFNLLALTAVVAAPVSGLSQTRERPVLTVEAAHRFAESCNGAPGQVGAPATVSERDGAICVTGRIQHGTAGAFMQAGDSSVVVVNSPGGEADDALGIAEEMSRRGASIVVNGYCLSACANYLFIAAREKVVLDGSLVGFHGAPSAGWRRTYTFDGFVPTEAQRAAAVESSEQMAHDLLDRQAALYKRAGVNLDVATLPPPLLPYDHTRWGRLFWEYGPRALSRFGVNGITYFSTPDDLPTWRRWLSHVVGIRCESDGDDAWLCSS